jgi:hypothetical protein
MDAAARTRMLRTMAISESVWYREVQQLVEYVNKVEGDLERAEFALGAARKVLKDCQVALAKAEEERWRLAMPQVASKVASEE